MNSILAAITVTLAASTILQDNAARRSFGDPAATALEQLVSRLYPGSRVVWKDSAWLDRPAEGLHELLLPGFVQRPIAEDRFLFAAAIAFSDEQRRVLEASRGGVRVTQLAATTRLAQFITDSTGTLKQYVSGLLDDGPDPILCADLQMLPAAETWPRLRVRYRSFHFEAGSTTVVEWTALLEPQTFRQMERLPLSVWIRSSDAIERSYSLRWRRIDRDTLEITAVEGGAPLTVLCREECVVPKDAVVTHIWR
jgi:hypothetical protein